MSPHRSRTNLEGRLGAFAPASVANVAVGFDLLGFALDVAGDTVYVERTPERTVTIAGITGLVTALPSDVRHNTATAGLERLIHDHDLDFGFRVTIEKGIPLGSGMGGSAASAVAAIVAANEFLERPLSRLELLPYALVGEAVASGSYHADNIAPSLLGGLTLATVSAKAEVDVVSIPVPSEVFCVLVHPHLEVATKAARGILKPEIKLKDHVRQSGHLAGFIAGCFTSDLELIRRSLTDYVIEPQRAHLIPGFAAVKDAALAHGALGCSISGAGPSVFAWAPDRKSGERMKDAMIQAFTSAGVATDAWVAPLSRAGARLI
jgi:homoserine kinase